MGITAIDWFWYLVATACGLFFVGIVLILLGSVWLALVGAARRTQPKPETLPTQEVFNERRP